MSTVALDFKSPEAVDAVRQDIADADALLFAMEARQYKRDLHAFVQASWSIVEHEQPFVDNWHVRELCKVLEQITHDWRQPQRVVINIPPGMMKSLLVSVFWPAWVWARWPGKRILTASYGSHLTIRDNLRVRDLIMSEWYQARFPLALVEDQNTKTRFNTEKGGWRIATSVGGVGTGEHPDIIIIDDPHTAAQADSDEFRTAARDWFDRTISTRGLTRNVCVILVMQRLHQDDLTGHVLKKGDASVVHVCFPMRYEPLRAKTQDDPGYVPDARDPRHTKGELLFPALFPETTVRKLEIDLGPFGTAGQLQQQPVPEGGGLFKREWFKFLDAAPKDLLRVVRGWDTAATERGGDWTVGAKIAEFAAGSFVVLDVVRGQCSPAGVEALMRGTAEVDGKDCAQREEQEGGSGGKIAIASHTKLLVGYDHKGVSTSGSKVTRSGPFRAQVEAGNVYLVRALWNEVYITELCNFPTGSHDDQVDASSAGFNALILEPRKNPVSLVWGTRR